MLEIHHRAKQCQNNNDFRCSGNLRNSVTESLAGPAGPTAPFAGLRLRVRVTQGFRSRESQQSGGKDSPSRTLEMPHSFHLHELRVSNVCATVIIGLLDSMNNDLHSDEHLTSLIGTSVAMLKTLASIAK